MSEVFEMAEVFEQVLMPRQWQARAETHRHRTDEFLAPHRRRISAGEPHPVWDFLFSYYSLRPGQLRCWHPGFGAVLTGDEAIRRYRGRRGYAVRGGGVSVDATHLHRRRDTIAFVARLLSATAQRPARLHCFGLHEWAMVYRSDTVRHDRVPLRLGRSATDAVVEAAGPLQCTHVDAVRFFTPAAAPRNAGTPSRSTQHDWEQPGCLHTNMDLYKWCYKLSPLVGSELLLNCLELAAAAREIDMRASPYDLTGYGFAPIRIEDRAGRAEYARCQNAIAERAASLREDLLVQCHLLMTAADASPSAPPSAPGGTTGR